MSQTIGTQSIQFDQAPYILGSASIVGTKEGEGPLGKLFDVVGEDDKFGEDTWEEAESTLQKEAASLAIGKAGLEKDDIRYIFGGDLLGQNIATTFGLMELNIPLFGLYGACSTAGESLSIAAMAVAAGYGEQVLAVTSSHFASAEKQFRFPLEYANRITGITTGKVVDYGVKDSMNMGAAMAPAACDTISQNLMDFNRQPQDYDKIITGDLGTVGQEILFDLMKKKGFDISNVHMDCGIEIFDSESQNTNAGGSGCGCSAVTLSAYILPQLEKGTWKRVLFVPTGALLSTVSFNEGQSVPGIAHGVVIEHAG